MKDWSAETDALLERHSAMATADFWPINNALHERDAEIARLKSDRLERIATQMMAKEIGDVQAEYLTKWAQYSIAAAKALIAELDKEKPE